AGISTAILPRAQVGNATTGAFQTPNSGSAKSNCNTGFIVLPGGDDASAVGLSLDLTQPNTTWDTWAFDNAGGNRGDITFKGSLYPICGVTFDFVYAGLSAGTSSAISRLGDNQRRTLYSYMSYALSSAGQDKLNTANYVSLPPAVAATLRRGFQANF